MLERATNSENVEATNYGTLACEKMLGRLNWKNDMVIEQWDSFSGHMYGRSNLETIWMVWHSTPVVVSMY